MGGALADQWLGAIEPDGMGGRIVSVRGIQVCRGEGSNTEGSSDIMSDGSVTHVYPSRFMILVDGGRVADYTAKEDYYKVSHSPMPFVLNGQSGEVLKESFNRTRFRGVTPGAQKVYYMNLQGTKGIKFGTRNLVNYFDSFRNMGLFLRAHGTYSIEVTDPIKPYAEVAPKNASHTEINSVNEQYLSEFLGALQTSTNQMSADGTRASYVTSKNRELGQYMAHILDEEWAQMRGMEIQAVGITSITYDEESQDLTNLRNRGAMMGDPPVRKGHVQTTIAEGFKNTGFNDNGAMADFMSMGMGMQIGGGFMSATSNTSTQQMQVSRAPVSQPIGDQPSGSQWAVPNRMAGVQPGGGGMTGQMPGIQPSGAWFCPDCKTPNIGRFYGRCGCRCPDTLWTYVCGNINIGRFYNEYGRPGP